MKQECASLRSIIYKGVKIQYLLQRKNVKNINLRIRADSSIYVSVSPTFNEGKIDAFVHAKGEYILSSLQRFKEIEGYRSSPKKYVSGETFNILGRGLRLRVKESSKETVFSDGVYLFLLVKDKSDFVRKQYLVTRYLNIECKDIFGNILIEVHPLLKKYGVDLPLLRIRNMKTRWGSCSSEKGIITLNNQLLRVPRNCIEYVMLHELCHLIQPNHSKKFYDLITMLMPDWKERKETLEKQGRYFC